MSMPLSIKTFMGVVLGFLSGLFVSEASGPVFSILPRIVEPIGTLWVNGIRMTVVPLVVSLLIMAIADEKQREQLTSLGRSTMMWFLALTTYAAMLTALIIPFLFNFQDFEGFSALPESSAPSVEVPGFRDWFVNLVPTNPLNAAANDSMLQLVVFTVILAFAIRNSSQDNQKQLVGFFSGLNEAMLVVIRWVMALAPIGVFSLIFTLTDRAGSTLAGAVGFYIVANSFLIILGTVSLYPIANLFSDVPYKIFVKACVPAQLVALSTRSSIASLPAMFDGAKQIGLREEVSGFVLPIAISVFKYASPIARGTGIYFVAALYGVDLGFLSIATIAISTVVLSFYVPGIPSGALLVMTPLFSAFGLPIEGIGLLIGLDLIIDMFLTVANTTANLTVATVVSERSIGRIKGIS